MMSESTISLLNCIGAIVMLIAAVLTVIPAAFQFAEFLSDKEKILAV